MEYITKLSKQSINDFVYYEYFDRPEIIPYIVSSFIYLFLVIFFIKNIYDFWDEPISSMVLKLIGFALFLIVVKNFYLEYLFKKEKIIE